MRVPADEWPAFVTAIERAAAGRGLGYVADINESVADGFFPMPLSHDAERASSARCYLNDAVRRRSNLAILPRTRVTGLRLDGNRVLGVTVECDGEIKELAAREVILSAGAIHSPAMLLRAGIGPADELKRLGIVPIVDRPGVGRNLQNHPYLHFALTLPRGMRLAPHLRRFAIAGIRTSSGLAGCPAGDLLLFTIGRVSPRSYGPDLAMVGAALYSPFSRGAVTLGSPDIEAPPRIDFGMLQDPRDPPRLIRAARLAESLLLDASVAGAYAEAFLLPPVMSLHQFNRPGVTGSLLALAAKAVLNAPAQLRRTIVGGLIRPGRWCASRHRRLSLSDAELLAALKTQFTSCLKLQSGAAPQCPQQVAALYASHFVWRANSDPMLGATVAWDGAKAFFRVSGSYDFTVDCDSTPPYTATRHYQDRASGQYVADLYWDRTKAVFIGFER